MLRIRSVLHKICREDKIYLIFNKFPPPQIRAVNEIMWENMVQPYRPPITIKYNTARAGWTYQKTGTNILKTNQKWTANTTETIVVL
jgi:hypothetical protein